MGGDKGERERERRGTKEMGKGRGKRGSEKGWGVRREGVR